MLQKTGKVISNKEIKSGYFLMDIKCPAIGKAAEPGQFLTVRCGNTTEPLLRKPFGFHRISSSGFEILYEVLGKGTRILSSLKPDDGIDILGPLGSGFTVPKSKRDFVIIAGGIGVAPLLALAEELVHRKPLVLIGAKTKDGILCEREFRRLGCNVKISTGDGSRGFKGAVTDLLEDLLSSIDYRLSTIYACGPKPMLKAVARVAKRRGLEAYASFEEYIACGVGACLGCAIRTKSGYKLICKDGPVFNLREMIW